MNGIGWVDFSSSDRSRVHNVLAMLKEKGTLDELGIGQVRDAFSDLLFPGFSTIQTQARYFLAIPKILLEWSDLPTSERKKRPLSSYLQTQENELARVLKENSEAAGLGAEGIIGHTVVEMGGVARRPSSTYWNGLRVFGLVRSDMSLTEFCSEWHKDTEERKAVDDDHGSDDEDTLADAVVSRPPGPRRGWPEGMTLRLLKSEAEFLTKRFCTASSCEDSVASQLLSSGLTRAAVSDQHRRFAVFVVWAMEQPRLSQTLRDRLSLAHRFSEAIEGAHIVFNRVLAAKLENEALQSHCAAEFDAWYRRVRHSQVFYSGAFDDWMSAPTLARLSVSGNTRDFLYEWNHALCGSPSGQELDALVSRQAERNKPGRSLLVRLPRQPSAWYGMKELEYRWGTCRRMLIDIVERLHA